MITTTVASHKIRVTYTSDDYSNYSFKLYVDGDLRDESDYLRLSGDWVEVVTAGVEDESGQKKELRFEVRKPRLFGEFWTWVNTSYLWRFVYDGKVV